MKRGWLLNVVLLAVVVVLAWLAWRTPSRDEAAQQTLSAQAPGTARNITLTRPGKPDIVLEKTGTQWQITAPVRARADEFQVLRMLTILEARPKAQFPAGGLARFDLETPAARLRIDGVDYAYGSINAVTHEQYVQRGDTVYAVELRHGAALPADAAALIRRALLGETERPTAIALPQFSLAQADGKWTITSGTLTSVAQTPAQTDVSQDDLQRYVDRWRQASAVRAMPHDGGKALADIRITLADGAALDIGILQREPQLVLWRRDTGLQYVFLAAAGQALLAHPTAPPVAPPAAGK